MNNSLIEDIVFAWHLRYPESPKSHPIERLDLLCSSFEMETKYLKAVEMTEEGLHHRFYGHT
mgnify:CR=1 FL=1